MPRPVPGPGALVSYIRTGSREARTAYRDLPDPQRFAYRDTVARVYEAALTRHCGGDPSEEQMHALVERVGKRHPQYAGGVKLLLRAKIDGPRYGRMTPRQMLTAQHLVVREIAKLHDDFREGAERAVAAALAARVDIVTELAEPDPEAPQHKYVERRKVLDAAFTGADPLVTVTLGLGGGMREIELLQGVERVGGRTIGTGVVRAWALAERQRSARASELGLPEAKPGAAAGDEYRCEAYSTGRLCRASLDRYGRLRTLTFMRATLFDEGRFALAAKITEAAEEAARRLDEAW